MQKVNSGRKRRKKMKANIHFYRWIQASVSFELYFASKGAIP